MKIINKPIILLLTLCILTSLTSCATVMHGSHQSIGIASNPSNASVWVDYNYVGNTPIIVQMTRRDNHVLRIELENFQPYEAIFSRQISGWVLGNIVFGGFIGLAVDAISGGIYQLTPDQVRAEMRSQNIVYTKNSNDTSVFIVLKPDSSWEKVGNLVASNQ